MEVDASGELTDLRQRARAHRRDRLVATSAAARTSRPRSTSRRSSSPRSAAAYWRGTRRTRSCSASTAPRGSRRRRSTRYLARLAEAERRDHRRLGAELDLFASPTRSARASPSSTPRAGSSAGSWRTTPGCGTSRRATSSSAPRTSPRAHLFETSGHLDLVRRGHVPAHAARRRVRRGRAAAQAGAGLLPQADELPDAQPDLPVPRPVVPGAAAAVLRVRHGLPLREVRGGARADPRPRLHPGRRAHLLHRDQMQGEIRSLLQFVLDLLRDYGLDDFYLELSTRDPEKSIGDRRGLGAGHRRAARRRRGVRSGASARSRRRRVLRTEDQCPGQGRDRAHLADVHHPGRPHAARPLRARVHRGRRVAAAAGDDPPGAVRLDRALLRHPHRALRGRVPGVARAGAGRRIPVTDEQHGYVADVAARCAPAACGSRWTPATTACRRRSAPTRWPRCRSCCSQAVGTPRRAR